MTLKGCRLLSKRQGNRMGEPHWQEARTGELKVKDLALAVNIRCRTGSVSGSLMVSTPA